MNTIKKILLLFIALNINTVYGQNCTQCDPNCTIGNDYSSALGKSNTSTGEASLAAGKYCTANNSSSISLGYYATASGSTSVAVGSNSAASGSTSIVIGQYLSSSGTNSITIGKGVSALSALSNSNSSSLMVGFGSTKSTFFVGTSSSTTKTGKIGIGDVTSPSAKLHIKADDGETASFLIEPNSWNTGKSAEIQVGNSANKIKSYYNKGFEFDVSGNYFFKNGKVGIGTSVDSIPKQKLEVAHTDTKGGIALNNVSTGTNFHSKFIL